MFNCLMAFLMGFPGSSAGKESACHAGDPSSIPGSGRSPGEGMGYPLQYSWASVVAQTVKNPHAIWDTWVQSLGWEDPLDEGMTTHSSILAWRIPWTAESARLRGHTSQSTGHDWSNWAHYRNWKLKENMLQRQLQFSNIHSPLPYVYQFHIYSIPNLTTIYDCPG